MGCLSPVIKCLGLELPELSPAFEKLVRPVYPCRRARLLSPPPFVLWSLRLKRTSVQITEMFYELDADKGGTIDMEEACSFFKKQAPPAHACPNEEHARSLPGPHDPRPCYRLELARTCGVQGSGAEAHAREMFDRIGKKVPPSRRTAASYLR